MTYVSIFTGIGGLERAAESRAQALANLHTASVQRDEAGNYVAAGSWRHADAMEKAKILYHEQRAEDFGAPIRREA